VREFSSSPAPLHGIGYECRLAAMAEIDLRIQDVVRRIQGEYLEMPGLRLTPDQARRLWRLDASSCDAVLGALVKSRFLARTRDGAFIRNDGNSPD
jgi:hypothetical protein